MATKMFKIYAVIFINIVTAFTTSSNFRPYLPFTPTRIFLINIVISTSKQHITVQTLSQSVNVWHIFTIHYIKILNFEISDKSLRENNNVITTNTGYFRLISRYTNSPIAYLLFLNDNLAEFF